MPQVVWRRKRRTAVKGGSKGRGGLHSSHRTIRWDFHGIFMGFSWDSMVFLWDLMGFYGILCGFYRLLFGRYRL